MKQNNRKTVAINNRQAAATRAYRDEMVRRGVTLLASSPFKASPKGAWS